MDLVFLNESNINNAPKAGTKIGNWTAWEKESARGFSYFGNAEKKWSLPHNYFTKLSLEGSGNIIGITKNIMNLTRELVWVLDTKLHDLNYH